jgi:hypothetical protein
VKRVAQMTAALVAAVAVWALSLPPRRTALSDSWSDGTVRGVLHVHSVASDGRGTVDEIAAAAASAGLQFVVLTDHGDATRRPDPPSYRSGVLIVDGVEISTRGGHYVAVGLPQSPYPLGGTAADVVEDVRRLGGLGIAAHPDSPKSELSWSDWSAPIDGVELVNPDTSWRVHAFSGGLGARWLLLKALLAYPARSSEAIATLLTESTALRERWRTIASTRSLLAIAGADAHAKVAWRDTEPGDNSSSLPIPSYESAFKALSVHVRPERPLTGDDAVSDADALLGGLRKGRVYVAIDGWAAPSAFEFTASGASIWALPGDIVSPGSPLTLRVRSNAPGGYVTTIWKDSQSLTERTEPEFEVAVGGEPAAYSVEVSRPNAPDQPPWITSNPIYVRQSVDSESPAEAATEDRQSLFDGDTTSGWSFESDKTSLATIDVAKLTEGPRVRLRYGLSGGASIGQYSAAAVATARGVASADAVAFTVRAERPMRLSLQVRAEVAGAPPERWERSVFVDTSDRERVVWFDTMTPVGVTHTTQPPAADVRAIMFVVDTTNTKPGASGRVWLGNVRLVSVRESQVRTVSTR